jgi:hypothetical protein
MSDFDPEGLFPPRPGGMVDTVRKQRQAEQDQAAALDEPAPSPRLDVPVDVIPPDLMTAKTIVVTTGTSQAVCQLLGADPQRRRAVVIALDEPVVIAGSVAGADDSRNAVTGAGLSAGGFTLPVGVPVVIWNRGAVWAAATSSTASRVSVLAESRAAP